MKPVYNEYLNSVDTEIFVDGKPCDYTFMNLDQRIQGHHTFEIGVNYHTKEKSVWAITVDDIFRETLGRKVIIKMRHIESGDLNEFHGVVTDIEVLGFDGDRGRIILKGGSPTILLDRDPNMGAYVDHTLHNIAADVIEQSGLRMDVENRPACNRIIPYTARYKETSFAFLSRVLAAYGEWFYYDGKKLMVGRPPEARQERRLTFDVELSEVRSMAGIRNLNTAYYDYDPSMDNYFEEESGTIRRANLPMKASKIASEPFYPNQTKLPTHRAIINERDMTETVRVMQSREYTKMSLFKAKCKSSNLRVGEVAMVLLPKSKDVYFIDLGRFMVIEINHRVSKPGHYENTFTGIARQTETLPDTHIVMPVAFPEPAIVTDNNDPRKQGRVKARFLWQKETEGTNWIRVQTPDAGKSNIVAANRGFVFIPEVGDQVMIGFQHGDPSRPYVMGSLFHIDNSKGAAPENGVKSIVTRSGHTIEFIDDESGSWGITIKDKNNNIIHLNTKEKEILISAPGKIKLDSTDIVISASKNIEIVAENVVSVNGRENILCKSKEAEIEVENGCKINAKEMTAITEKTEIQSTKENLLLYSGKEVISKSKSQKIRLS